jgi:glutamate/aspartate transport system permease protein
MSYKWNWGVFFQLSPDGTYTYLQLLLFGAGWTLATALLAWAIALSVGTFVGVIRTSPVPWLVRLGNAYVELFRNIPLLVQMFLWYFVVPELLPADWGRWVKRDMPQPQFNTAVVCLGLYTASRVAEQVRSGIDAIPRGQRNAALAMGLTPSQAYRYVLIPVAYRTIIPPLTSDFLGVFKNSSLALTIGVLELTSQARQIEEYTFAAFEAFTAATVLYCLVTGFVILVMRIIERRTRIAGTIAVGAQ